jgi:ABC-type cobalamin transport system permease subunit
MKKYIPDSMMLTKESFEQHMLSLREKQAKQYGMTLEQWDNAVANGGVVQALTGSSSSHNTQQL